MASMFSGGVRSSLSTVLVVAAVAVVTTGLTAAGARAQEGEPEDPRTAQARALFEAGRVAFEAASYEDALRHFRDAFELSGRTALLYNIGVAADRLRRDREALEAFERYLAEAPADSPQRPDVEVRVRVLREQLTRPGAPPDARPARGGDRPEVLAGWAMTIGGAVVLATGVVFLGVGESEASTVANAPEGTPWPDVAGAADRADWMRVSGWVLGGAGLALAAVGLVLVLTAPSPREQVSLRVGPTGVALAWRAQ